MTDDPCDTCKPGDPDPTPNHDAGAVCLNGHRNGWLCTRHPGHIGTHVCEGICSDALWFEWSAHRLSEEVTE